MALRKISKPFAVFICALKRGDDQIVYESRASIYSLSFLTIRPLWIMICNQEYLNSL